MCEKLYSTWETRKRVLSWTDITWPSEWLEGRLLHEKESFYGWILYGQANGLKAKESSYGWLLHSWMNGLESRHLWVQLLDGRVNCSRADNEWTWRQILLVTAHIYPWEKWVGGRTKYKKRNTHGGKSGRKEKPLMATRDDDFILIYMTLMKSRNPIWDGFVLIWNEIMVSTQLHLGQREPDDIHTHWQTLMKEVYRDSIWELRQLLHSNEFAVYGDSIRDPRHIVHLWHKLTTVINDFFPYASLTFDDLTSHYVHDFTNGLCQGLC